MITIDFLTYPAAAGTIALTLPGQLHAIAQYEQETMEYENIIFHPDILISRKTDVCSTDFLSPLFSGARFVPPLYPPDAPHYHEIAACLDANDQICRTMPYGYELFLKSQLFQLFFNADQPVCSFRSHREKPAGSGEDQANFKVCGKPLYA